MIKKIFLSFVLTACIFSQNSDSTLSMSGGLGSVTIDGELYNRIALRPVIPIGKIKLGLDFYININSNGDIYTADYNFNNTKDGIRSLIDKIRFIQYANINDPFYFMFGNLNNVMLGNGILVNGYTNALEYPSNRKFGFRLGADFGTIGIECILSDFKYDPGLIAFRMNYKIMPKIDMGISIASDINQYAGLSDSDNDDYPDVYDHFPNDADKWDEAEENKHIWEDIFYNYAASDLNINFQDWFLLLPLNHNMYDPNTNDKNEIFGFSLDLNYRFKSNLLFYTQFGTLLTNAKDYGGAPELFKSSGFGIVPLGVIYSFGTIKFLSEYRYNTKYFIFNYWDKSYEINRSTVVSSANQNMQDETDKIIIKENTLSKYDKEMNGIHSKVSANFANILYFTTSYSYMFDKENKNNNSFNTILSLSKKIIPRLEKAEAFYQQNNVPNPFDFEFTGTSLYGFLIGFKISQDMILQYKETTSFIISAENNSFEPLRTILVETQFSF